MKKTCIFRPRRRLAILEADPFYAAYMSSIRSTRWQLSWLALMALAALSSLTCLAALTALALAACLGERQPL